jgi:hypothetical protein
MAFMYMGSPETGFENLPSDFKLFQNYPLAFEKKTSIGFDIPQNVLVKIAVYDLYGRELEVLINDFLLPGTYEIEWNADAYSSGVYIYKMVAGSFADSKKMFLLKP